MRILIILMFLFTGVSTFAQYNTGDNELDRTLVRIDADARLDFGAFKTDIRAGYNITEKKIDYLSSEIGMKAGDIYMTVRIAKISGRSIDDIVTVYRNNKSRGWGAMAKELGIKPGSAEFHQLKGTPGKSKGKGKGKN